MVSVVSLTRCPSKCSGSSDVTPEGIPTHREKRWEVVRRRAIERPAVPGTGVKESQLPNCADLHESGGSAVYVHVVSTWVPSSHDQNLE